MALPATTDLVSLKFAFNGEPFCYVGKSGIDTTLLGHAFQAQPFSHAPQLAAGGAFTLTCDAGSFTLTGQDATFAVTRTLACDAGSFTLTGQDATLSVARYLACDAGAYTLTGQDADFTYVPSVGVPGGGIGPIEGSPYKRATKEQIRRLRRLMGMDAEEARAFLKQKPQEAALALAVLDIAVDPDALIDAVLGSDELSDAKARLQAAADIEALRRIQAFIEDETLTLLLIFAAME